MQAKLGAEFYIVYLFVPLIDMTFHQKIVNSPLIEIFTRY